MKNPNGWIPITQELPENAERVETWDPKRSFVESVDYRCNIHQYLEWPKPYWSGGKFSLVSDEYITHWRRIRPGPGGKK